MATVLAAAAEFDNRLRALKGARGRRHAAENGRPHFGGRRLLLHHEAGLTLPGSEPRATRGWSACPAGRHGVEILRRPRLLGARHSDADRVG